MWIGGDPVVLTDTGKPKIACVLAFRQCSARKRIEASFGRLIADCFRVLLSRLSGRPTLNPASEGRAGRMLTASVLPLTLALPVRECRSVSGTTLEWRSK